MSLSEFRSWYVFVVFRIWS